jgi:hypothetical protein
MARCCFIEHSGRDFVDAFNSKVASLYEKQTVMSDGRWKGMHIADTSHRGLSVLQFGSISNYAASRAFVLVLSFTFATAQNCLHPEHRNSSAPVCALSPMTPLDTYI